MSNTAIKVENLGKKYFLGESRRGYKTIRDSLSAGTKKLLSRAKTAANGSGSNGRDEIWALRDVSFDVKPGEVVGLIGRNGAGKSTLLKVLSRITEPTVGKIDIFGRVGSLLEVGTGFHPELSGRDNIYLSGAILGMKKAEIARHFDEIVAFAEIEKFVDTPVKHYSSGMYLRLAFAVAAHLQPEILLIDEVLAVGDAMFQKKCLGKMNDVANQGRTVIFVSHNMVAVKDLCHRGLLIEEGSITFDGSASNCISQYYKSINIDQDSGFMTERDWTGGELPGNEKIKIRRAAVYAEGKVPGEPISTEDNIVFEVEFYNHLDAAVVDVTWDLHNIQGIHIAHIGKVINSDGVARGWYKSKTMLPKNILNTEKYIFSVQMGRNQRELLFRMGEVLTLSVEDAIQNRGSKYSKIPGVIHPLCSWEMQLTIED